MTGFVPGPMAPDGGRGYAAPGTVQTPRTNTTLGLDGRPVDKMRPESAVHFMGGTVLGADGKPIGTAQPDDRVAASNGPTIGQIGHRAPEAGAKGS